MIETQPSGTRAVVSQWPAVAVGAFVLAFFAFCYADVFRILWIQWNTNEANSHGFLIPWIAAYLLWMARDRLPGLRSTPAWGVGLPTLVASLGVLLAGRLVGIVGLQEVSMVGTLWGLSLLLLGWRGLAATWFPIAYLLFMMPIWDLATESMYYPLQLFAARGVVVILSAFGIPVFRDGTLLVLSKTSVEVALACSGINFLMAVLAIGTLLAYLTTRQLWRRVLIVATALVVALLANPFRVALIVYSFYSGLASPHHSHMWQGMLVSLAAFAVLFFLARLIAGSEGGVEPPSGRGARLAPAGSPRLVLGLAALSCALLAAAGYARPLTWPTPSLDSLKLHSLPYQVGEWSAVPNVRPPSPAAGVVLPDELWREYRRADGRSVKVYVGRFVHGAGGAHGLRYWSDEFDRVTTAPAPASGRGLVLNAAVAGRGAGATPVVYWYQLGSHATISRVEAKLFAVWNALTRTGAGPIAVVVFDDQGASSGIGNSHLVAFADEFVASLRSGLVFQAGGP